MPERKDSPFVKAPEGRFTDLPEPTTDVLTYRGEALSAGLVMRLWRRGQKLNQRSRAKIIEARAYRRREESSLIQLAATWRRQNPEAANWVVDVRPERTTLDEVLVALSGVIEPEYEREALGFLDRDHEDAEACQAWMEEWRKDAVPTQPMFGKAVEDGQFGWEVLPTFLDREGVPTFFETLEEDAYATLPDDAKKTWRKDDDDERRYVRVDAGGKKRVRPEYGTRRDAKSEQAHKDAIARYLLQHKPLAVRLLPALDCAPILKRGRGKDRWECAALVTRELFLPEELVEEGYGWPGLGDRLLVPLAYNADGSHESLSADEFGSDGMVYLYTARLVCKDKAGHERPVLAWTVGGTSTSWTTSGPGEDTNGEGDVGYIDFYEALRCKRTDCRDRLCGVQGALWGYHGGMHSEDDSPDEYWRPALWHVIPLIRQLEGNQTSINATITQTAFTGHVQRIDAQLAAVEGVGEAAILDDTGELRVMKRPPGPGQIEPATGPVEPFHQASVGRDAWQKVAADQLTLQQVTASDQQPAGGQSGHAQIVQMMTSQRAKRQIREGVAGATEGMGSCALRLMAALHHRYEVGWPLQTTQERAVGDAVVSARDLAMFDKRWVGEGNYAIATEYPEEENLARVDMELSLIVAGVGNPERVWKALGERDYQTEWKKALKWRLRNSPAYLMRAEQKLAQQTGDQEMASILKELQAQQQITRAGVPGAKNGVPTAALSRGGQQPAPQRASMVGNGSDIRGGIQSATVNGDRRAADAEAAMTQSGAA